MLRQSVRYVFRECAAILPGQPDVKAVCARQSQGFAADCTSKTEERGMTLHGAVEIFWGMKKARDSQAGSENWS